MFVLRKFRKRRSLHYGNEDNIFHKTQFTLTFSTICLCFCSWHFLCCLHAFLFWLSWYWAAASLADIFKFIVALNMIHINILKVLCIAGKWCVIRKQLKKSLWQMRVSFEKRKNSVLNVINIRWGATRSSWRVFRIRLSWDGVSLKLIRGVDHSKNVRTPA